MSEFFKCPPDLGLNAEPGIPLPRLAPQPGIPLSLPHEARPHRGDVLGQGLAAHSYHLHLRHKMGLVRVLLCYLIPNLLLLLANVKLLD